MMLIKSYVRGFIYYWNNINEKWEGLINNSTYHTEEEADKIVSDLSRKNINAIIYKSIK